MENQSNTKLTPGQKEELKEFKSWQMTPKTMAFGHCDGCTVLVQRVSREFLHVSSAYASSNEKKIRPKVGEYEALQRWGADERIPLRVFDYMADWNIEAIAEEVAGMFS